MDLGTKELRSEDGPQDDPIFMGSVERRKQKNWEEIGVKSRVDRPEKTVTNWVKCRRVAATTQLQTNTWKAREEDFTGLCKWDWCGPQDTQPIVVFHMSEYQC